MRIKSIVAINMFLSICGLLVSQSNIIGQYINNRCEIWSIIEYNNTYFAQKYTVGLYKNLLFTLSLDEKNNISLINNGLKIKLQGVYKEDRLYFDEDISIDKTNIFYKSNHLMTKEIAEIMSFVGINSLGLYRNNDSILYIYSNYSERLHTIRVVKNNNKYIYEFGEIFYFEGKANVNINNWDRCYPFYAYMSVMKYNYIDDKELIKTTIEDINKDLKKQ
jgi:hypothetical protein